MAQLQEQRYYICKICNKECSSGKSLGGHMRSHLPLISASKKSQLQPKFDRKIELQDPDFDVDDDDDGDDQSNSAFPGQEKIKNRNSNPELNKSYELRDDPKKSWKISSGTENGFSSKGFSCKECGKEFLTLRAVSGHMRCHSSKNVKGDHQCKECGKSFDSLRAMYGHMKSHSNKRLKVIDNEISSTTVVLELDDLCPVRKKRSRIRYNNSNITPNPSFSSLNESTCVVSEFEQVKLAAKSLIMLSRGVKDLIGLNSVTESSSDDDSIYFDSESSSGSKKVYGNVSLLFSTETEKIVSHDQFDVVMMDSSLLSVTDGDSMSLESRKSKEHECSICFKVFPSGRALGGHKRAHYYTTKTKQAINVNEDVGEDIDLNFPVHNLWWAETRV